MSKNNSLDSAILRRRIDCVFAFDAIDSLGNGEPNDGGRARQDPETLHHLWNNSALKSFFRAALEQRYGGEPGHRVLIQHGYPINRSQTEAFTALGVTVDENLHADDDGAEKTKKNKAPRLDEEIKSRARDWIAAQFIDARWFGAVLDTGYQLGNLTGPLQFTIARATHPGVSNEMAITRRSVTTEKDQKENKGQEMGAKHVVPYALYRGNWFFTPAYGEKTKFSVQDLREFIDIFRDPFRSRQSAGLGLVTLRKAWIFLHEGALGNMQAGVLDSAVKIHTDSDAPRSMRDFNIEFSDRGLADRGIQVFTEETLDALVEEVSKNPGKAR